ncbi:hypothetical protein M758_6G039300 [Ceratodon purpureus]|nr:hypothetical protein M758_6G039300 [Ceratodon purpureus]
MPTKTVHVVPMLSPVLEDFVPPQFRGNVPDTPRAEAPAVVHAEAGVTDGVAEQNRKEPVESESRSASEEAEGPVEHGLRSRVVLTLLHWRKRAQRGPVQVTQKKPVHVQGLRRQKSKKYPTRSRRSVGHYLNPLCLLARLRDTYIHMMNTVATSGIVPGGPMGDDSGTHGSTLFFSREFDTESISQLVELERSSSKPDAEYRQNMAFARNLSRVKPSGDDLLSTRPKPGGNAACREPVLSRSKSTKTSDDSATYFSISNGVSKSGRRLSGEPALTRSKSNHLSDEVFFARKLKGSKNKLHINPYADSKWSAESVSNAANVEPKQETKSGPLEFQFQQEKTNSGTEVRSLQGASFFTYKR